MIEQYDVMKSQVVGTFNVAPEMAADDNAAGLNDDDLLVVQVDPTEPGGAPLDVPSTAARDYLGLDTDSVAVFPGAAVAGPDFH